MTSTQKHHNIRRQYPSRNKANHHWMGTKVEYIIKQPSQPHQQENSISNQIIEDAKLLETNTSTLTSRVNPPKYCLAYLVCPQPNGSQLIQPIYVLSPQQTEKPCV